MSLSRQILSPEEYSRYLRTARDLLAAYLSMSDDQWEIFKQGFIIRTYQKDDLILRKGDTDKYLFILLVDSTRHYLMADGEEKSFDFSFQYEFSCFYSSFIQQEPSQFFVQAMDESILASMPYSFLQQLYTDYPESNYFGRTAVEQYYLWREKREISLMVDSARDRYVKLLEKYPIYLEQVPLKYLASYLNIKPESLSRIRKQLARRR